jgi:hypothetical protein
MWSLPLRIYEERLQDHLHQRRRKVRPMSPGVLRMLQAVLRQRLLLHDQLWQHAGLLQHLLKQNGSQPKIYQSKGEKPTDSRPWAFFVSILDDDRVDSRL